MPSAFFTLVEAFDFPLSESSFDDSPNNVVLVFLCCMLEFVKLVLQMFPFVLLICLVQLFVQVFTLLSVYLSRFVMEDKLGLVAFFTQLVRYVADPIWGLLGLSGSKLPHHVKVAAHKGI